MAAESKTKSFPFLNRGLFTQIDPALLSGGQYMALLNMTSVQEGGMTTRAGRRYLGHLPLDTLPHTIRKLSVTKDSEVPGVPTSNPRYLGAASNIYRTGGSADTSGGSPFSTVSLADAANLVATGVVDNADEVTKRWNLSTYHMGASGKPWGFFACPNAMLKDSGDNPYTVINPDGNMLMRWGILPAWGVVVATDGGAGNLDGGDTGSPAGSAPYDWVFVYVSGVADGGTGNKGNPSFIQLNTTGAGVLTTCVSPPLPLHNKQASLLVWGTDDPQVTDIWIYRRGGVFPDNVWRKVGSVVNPGVSAISGKPNSAGFTDNQSDSILLFADQAEFDNDPPVLSNSPNLIKATLAADKIAGWQTIRLSQDMVARGLTRGSVLTFEGNSATASFNNSESVVIAQINWSGAGVDTAIVYLQYTHSAGEIVTCNAITAQPCWGTISDFDSVFVFGDPNNPHVLYKSKNSAPESFPLRQADGTINAINVGTPDNGIQNAASFRGSITCMNVNGLYQVYLYQGQMVGPVKTPAARGLYSRYAWCQGDNVLYYLAYDGIYSWDGSQSVNLTAEAIDGIFHSLVVNGIQPLDLNPTNSRFCRMVYERNTVLFHYRDVQGVTQRIRYNIADRRWMPEQDLKEAANIGQVTEMYLEEDTGNVIFGRYDVFGGAYSVDDQVSYISGTEKTSDEFTNSTGDDGDSISFQVRTGWFDLGSRIMKKLLQELILECDPRNAVTVKLYYDYAATAGDVLTIPASSAGRQWISLLETLSGSGKFYGKECYVVSFEFVNPNPANKVRSSFWSLSFKYIELAEVTAGAVGSWLDLEADTDKRLYQCAIEFDVKGTGQTLSVDVLRGVDGNILQLGAQQLTLANPVILGAGRAKKVFPLQDAFIAKMLRVTYANSQAAATPATNPGTAAGPPFFLVFKIEWLKEILPPDIVSFTPWEQNENQQYGQEVYIEVDTNGQVVPVAVQVDGNTAAPIAVINVRGTSENRRSRYTLPPNSVGFSWRLAVDPGALINFSGTCDVAGTALTNAGGILTVDMEGMTVYLGGAPNTILTYTDPNTAVLASDAGTASGIPIVVQGKFQLYSHKFTLVPNQPGPIGHTYDWDTLNYAGPKKLNQIVFEYDTEGDAPPLINMDVIQEDGVTTVIKYQQFQLTGTGRAKEPFLVTDDTVVSSVRIYPDGASLPIVFREWKYAVDKIDYPAFQASPTEYSDLGYAYEKILRELTIQCDTGGVTRALDVQADGRTVMTFNIKTNSMDRHRVLTFPSEVIGLKFRIVPRVEHGQKFQIFDHKFHWIPEPPSVFSWNSYIQAFSYNGWKFLKQIWVEYRSGSPIEFFIHCDNDASFYSVVLPAHSNRDVERFYLPAENGSVLNKSKVYRFRIVPTACLPFKLYQDATRVEWMAIGAEQRQGYQQAPLAEPMPMPTGAVV